MAERDYRSTGPIAADYRRALLEARRLGLAQTKASVDRLREAFTDSIERLLADETAGTISAERAAALRGELREMLRRLEVRIVQTTQQGVALTLNDVTRIHYEATRAILGRFNPDALSLTRRGVSLAARFQTIPIRAVAALTARTGVGGGAATFQTLVHRHIVDAAPALDRIITSAVARGVSPGRLTNDIAGLLAAGDPKLLAAAKAARRGADLSAYGLSETQVSGVRSLWYDARRIAVSEPMNAYREATAQAGVVSPVIAAYRWQLSGRHAAIGKYDECDSLAEADAYGLGPGFYPPDKWPLAPHPFCGCTQGEVLFRDPEDWLTPKDSIDRQRVKFGAAPEGTDPDDVKDVRRKTAAIIRAA